jgi:hypothetical protein
MKKTDTRRRGLIAFVVAVVICAVIAFVNDAAVRRDGGRYGPDAIWHPYGTR